LRPADKSYRRPSCLLRKCCRISIRILEARLVAPAADATFRMKLERVAALASIISSRASQNSASRETLVFLPARTSEYFVPDVFFTSRAPVACLRTEMRTEQPARDAVEGGEAARRDDLFVSRESKTRSYGMGIALPPQGGAAWSGDGRCDLRPIAGQLMYGDFATLGVRAQGSAALSLLDDNQSAAEVGEPIPGRRCLWSGRHRTCGCGDMDGLSLGPG